MSSSEYLLDNAAPETAARFHGLEAVLDPVTFRHLDDLGVDEGSSCLEVGAGGGSVARWMAAMTGVSGRVLATDVNPDWCDGGGAPNLEVRRHDIVGDPLPEQAFDVVHARLVLGHLGARDEVLETLVRSLRPGGFLLVEDFDDMVPACPHAPTERELLVNRIREAFCALLRTGGGDNGYPRTLPWRLRQAGLVGAGASGHLAFATGGSEGSKVERANIEQVGDRLVAAGLATADELRRYLAVMADSSFQFALPLFISAWGRAPGATSA